MANQGLAIEPQLAAALGEQEDHPAPAAEKWNQEQEVHARAQKLEPEHHREQLQNLIPVGDLKRLVL